MDEIVDKFLKLTMIFIHYLVFDIFYSNREMNQCYCYVFEKIKIVFKLLDKTIENNSIFPRLTSTKDLSNYWLKLHKLLILKLSLNCVPHRINIEILILLLIFFLQFFLNLFYYYQRNFIHAFIMMQLII